mgnify:CR=1 FL=1
MPTARPDGPYALLSIEQMDQPSCSHSRNGSVFERPSAYAMRCTFV